MLLGISPQQVRNATECTVQTLARCSMLPLEHAGPAGNTRRQHRHAMAGSTQAGAPLTQGVGALDGDGCELPQQLDWVVRGDEGGSGQRLVGGGQPLGVPLPVGRQADGQAGKGGGAGSRCEDFQAQDMGCKAGATARGEQRRRCFQPSPIAPPWSNSPPTRPPSPTPHLKRVCLIFCLMRASGPMIFGASWTSCSSRQAVRGVVQAQQGDLSHAGWPLPTPSHHHQQTSRRTSNYANQRTRRNAVQATAQSPGQPASQPATPSHPPGRGALRPAGAGRSWRAPCSPGRPQKSRQRRYGRPRAWWPQPWQRAAGRRRSGRSNPWTCTWGTGWRVQVGGEEQR